ncbi:DUF4329 domain-containing protein [Endozoicomonas atrinae]|uniref:DUF4329 domain-containing protein n=1 Tax=Endozoicomonas atrinae TaxID=1333660 RepID=UPI003B00739F
MQQISGTIVLLLGLILNPPDTLAKNDITSPRHPVIFIPGYYPMPFNSELDAVISAANQYNPTSIREDREFIGGIFKDLNRSLFYYSAFAGKRGEDQITATLTYPKHLQLIAVWHTHGAGQGLRLYFSAQDIKLA